MEILEKVAYLKGLAEGMGVDSKSKEGKLIGVIIDVLDDIALELQDIRNEQNELEEGLDAVSDDLSEVESYLYEDDEDDGDEDDDEGDEVYEAICPNCREKVFFDETVLADGEVVCPNCGKKLEFDLRRNCPGFCGACEPDEPEEPEAPEEPEESEDLFEPADEDDLPF